METFPENENYNSEPKSLIGNLDNVRDRLNSFIIKKNSEIDFVLLLPSPVGNLKYYCKAKNKQRCVLSIPNHI